MSGHRDWDSWIAQYSRSHRDPVNRLCHTIGIPMIAASVVLAPAVLIRRPLWRLPVWLFVAGWALQFAGHAFEGKPPEFLRDSRFLLVGLRWWWAKAHGRV